MKYFIDAKNYKEYVHRNRDIIIYSIISAIICYGYELFNYTLSIDEEIASFLKASDLKVYIIIGRWGTYLLNHILSPSSTLPYFPTMITVLCIALTSILFINSEKGNFQSKLIFSILFISYPLHSYYLAFNTVSHYYGIGMVLSVVSYIGIKESLENPIKNITSIIFYIILLTFAFSIYQGLIPIFIILVIFHLLKTQLSKETSLKETIMKVFYFAITFFIAFIFYFIIDYTAKHFLLDSNNIQGSGYLENFIGWGKAPVNKVLFNMLYYTGGNILGLGFYGGFSIITIILLIPFFIFKIIKKIKTNLNRSITIVLILLLILAPFSIMYLSGSQIPARSLMALPFLLAIIWYLSFQYANSWLRKLMIVAAFLIFISNTYYTTRLFYATNVAWQADRDMANRIVERIYHLNLPQKINKIQLAFIGKYQHPSNELFIKSGIFGASFFEWDNGNRLRMNTLIRTLGVDDFNIASQDKINHYTDTIQLMPSWPRKGSVTLINDIVIVKLSDENY